MKLSRLIFLFVVALILLVVGGGGYSYYKEWADKKAFAENQARWFKNREVNSYPQPDKGQQNIPSSYPRPESEWKANEKTVYQNLLSSNRFDVLVVPFQVQEYALDRPTRSLMTAELALLIERAQKINAPDPYLVARALGDGDRRLDEKGVQAFAETLGVKKIVWGYVGHDRKNHMILTIKVQERGTNGALNDHAQARKKTFENIDFTDERPPIEIYQSMLPEILTAIGVDNTILTMPRPIAALDAAAFPADPLASSNAPDNPAEDALIFQLLGYIAPAASERVKECFAEKSYLALLKLSPESPDYRVLKARAMMMLGLRPGALQVLGEPKNAEEQELRAVLNGNQPDVDLSAAQIKPAMKRLIANLDAYKLASDYAGIEKSKSINYAKDIELPNELWRYFAYRAATERDAWAQFDNIQLKKLLDNVFPIKDYSTEEIFNGAYQLGNGEKLETLSYISPINHIRKLFEINGKNWSRAELGGSPSAIDYLQLFEAISEDNLMRYAKFLTNTQGNPVDALKFLDQIKTVFKGYPPFAFASADAQFKKARTSEGAESQALLKSAYENAFNAMYWEQGQTRVSAEAYEIEEKLQEREFNLNLYGIHDNLYASDFPYRSFYPVGEMSSSLIPPGIQNAMTALKYSTSDIAPVYALNQYPSSPTKVSVLKLIEGRFAGNSDVSLLLAKNSLAGGDFQAAERYYRESIKSQPTFWEAYIELGYQLIRQGQVDNAFNLFMEYPGFKQNSTIPPIAIANTAFQAGSRFYWLGDFTRAKTFYELTANQQTGAGAEIANRARLKLINGDVRAALRDLWAAATHYNNTYEYTDSLSILHAMGDSKTGWEIFNSLVNQIDDSHIWESVMVGNRKEMKSAAEIGFWVQGKVEQNIGKRANRAANYLFREGVTDRIPTADLPKILDDLALPAWKQGNYVTESTFEGAEETKGPRISPSMLDLAGTSPGKAPPVPVKTRIKTSLAYFAEAYFGIRNNDFTSAWKTLNEAAGLYDMTTEDKLDYLLPYYTLAAAKTGNSESAEKYMADFTPQLKGFNYYLAQAILTGLDGKTGESVQNLKSALFKRPFTEDRPLQTEYQYADICKILYEATHRQEYKDLALDWAKKNQVFQPWFSWAYAMEAIFTDNTAERKQAIAMTFYLDPQSEMLKQFSRKEVDAAVKEFKSRNPFTQNAQSSINQAI